MPDGWNWFDSLPGDAQEEYIALRKIAEEVASISDPDRDICPWGCTFNIDNCYHAETCLVTKARKLISKKESDDAESV